MNNAKFRKEDDTQALWLYLAVEAILAGTAASAKELKKLYKAKTKMPARRKGRS